MGDEMYEISSIYCDEIVWAAKLKIDEKNYNLFPIFGPKKIGAAEKNMPFSPAKSSIEGWGYL